MFSINNHAKINKINNNNFNNNLINKKRIKLFEWFGNKISLKFYGLSVPFYFKLNDL